MGYLPLFVLILPTINFGKWPPSLRLNPDALMAGSQGSSLNREALGVSGGDGRHSGSGNDTSVPALGCSSERREVMKCGA